MIEEIVDIKNWGDLKSEFDSMGEFWVYRGQANSSWKLETSIDRFIFKDKFWAEARMLHDLSKNYQTFNQLEIDFSDDVQKVALLQHHGAPTRFLDVTHSPYVAAYFAFENIPPSVNSCSIYAFHYLSLEMRTLALLDSKKSFLELESNFNSAILNNPEIFSKLVLKEDQENFIGVINPQQIFSRLRNQSGSFLCQGNINSTFEENLVEITKAIYPTPILKKYVLPTSMRLDVLADLRKMNITRFTLFQNFDGFAKSLSFECEIQVHREDKYRKE